MKEFDNCPRCKFDLNGEDIYKYFFEKYSKDGVPDYARTIIEIEKGISQYHELYKNAPSIEELKKMPTIELAAWESAQYYGWTKENPKCFRKEIGIEIQGFYDGVSYYKCPECGHKWKRFDWVDDKYLTE